MASLAWALGVAQVGGDLVVLVVDRRFLLLGDALEVLLRGLQLGRRGCRAQTYAAGGFIDQIDRLVGQMAVGDVADAQVSGSLHGLVGDLDLVVLFVAAADAEQDVDRLLEGGLLHHDRLEAPLQGRVAFDVLAVLVERGRADALQLAPRQRWLEDVRRVDRALCCARADERVQLVDEQHRVVGVAQLFDDLLEALLELAAVLRAGDEAADVERQDTLVEQRLRHVAGDDALRKALGDRGLADARLADERGVVLGAARQDLDDALDLLLAADDRVDLARADCVGQVDAQLIHGGRLRRALGLRRGPGARALAEDANDLMAHLVQVHAQALQHAGGDALALAHQAQQQVLRADVVVAQATRFVDGEFDDALGARRQAHFTHDRAIAAADDELHGGPDLGQLDVHVLEDARGDAFTLPHQAEQQVFGADVVVVEALRLVLGKRQYFARAVRELVEAIHDPTDATKDEMPADPTSVTGATERSSA